MVKSLRWRVQIWHAWVLLAVLMIFGAIVYDQLWRSRLQQIDAELDRSAGIIMTRLRWLLPWPNPGNRNQGGNRGANGGGQGDRTNEQRPADNPSVAASRADEPTRREPGENDRGRQSGERTARREERERGNSSQRRTGGTPGRADSPDRTSPSAFGNGAFPQNFGGFWPPLQVGDPITAGAGVSATMAQNAAQRLRGASGRTDDPRIFYRPPERGMANLWLPDEFRQLFESQDESRLYFVIWDHFGTLLQKSDGAPDDIEYPNLHVGPDFLPKREVRSRGMQREVIHVARYDMDVLIGRSLRQDMAAQRASGLLLTVVGLGVLCCGLVGGWWLSNQAVRPIAAMSATAAAISAQNLDQRIDIRETDDELGQLAQVLNRTFDRLQAAFEQQGQFTADASHELRTPLSVILAHAELALARPRNAGEYQDALSACQRAAQRMKSLLDGLLTLARFDAGQGALESTSLDLEEVTLDCIELVRPLAAERGITIRAATEPLQVTGDHKRLEQVLTNLLTNAIRYNRDGGTIDLHLAQVDRMAVITVADSGQGIPADHLPHIFDRFYRADAARSDGGSGLGLSICKTIVAAHGGSIYVDSQAEVGTTFEVRLPLANAANELTCADLPDAAASADRLPLAT